MIRYKKRKFQQGGSSPAADYAAGSSAVATTFTPIQNPYKRIETQPEGGGRTAGRGAGGGGSRIGRGQFNSVMQQGDIKAKNLIHLTEAKNAELNSDKERLIKLYSINEEYFESSAGLKELNNYKSKLSKYRSELGALENAYSNALKNAGGDAGRIAFSSDGNVFVLDSNRIIKSMSYEQASIEHDNAVKENPENSYQYSPLSIGSLLEHMDDENQYGGSSDLTKGAILDSLNSIVDEQQVSKNFISGIQRLFKQTEWLEDGSLMVKGGNSKDENDIILSALDIKQFEEKGVESDKMLAFLNIHYTGAPRDVRNYFTEKAYQSLQVNNDVKNADLKDKSQVIRTAIRQDVFKTIKNNLVTKRPGSPEEQNAAIAANNDMVNFAMQNDYNKAETGLADTHKVTVDAAIQQYNPDGSKAADNKDASNNDRKELSVTVNMSNVPSSVIHLNKNHTYFQTEDSIDIENITFDQFEAITNVADPTEAVMGDGFSVSNVKFDSDHYGFVPVEGEPMSVVAAIATKDGLALDAIPLIHDLQKRYEQAHNKAIEDVKNSKSKSSQVTIDEEKLIEEKTDSYMRDEVQEVLKDTKYNGLSLEEFYNNFIYKNFYKVLVVGNIDSTDAFGEEGEAMKYVTDNLSKRAQITADKYELYGSIKTAWDDVIMTSILIPANGLTYKASDSSSYDLGKGATTARDHLLHNAPIDMRDLLSNGSNKSLEKFILKKALQE